MSKRIGIILSIILGIILLFIIDFMCIFIINRPLFAIKKDNVYIGLFYDTYNCLEYSVPQIKMKKSKFACQIDNKKDEELNFEEHSFLGKVIETYQSYIIVSPNESEIVRKSSDKFRVELGDYNDAIYKVGTNVKITYIGDIKETYPAQIEAVKIELKSADFFELIFHSKNDNKKRQIIDKNNNDLYNYDVYIYDGIFEIIIDNKTYLLEDALNENKITVEEIISKANDDLNNQKIKANIYKDGGSIEYYYDDYTIIKFHTLNGNRNVYFGNKDLKIDNVK